MGGSGLANFSPDLNPIENSTLLLHIVNSSHHGAVGSHVLHF